MNPVMRAKIISYLHVEHFCALAAQRIRSVPPSPAVVVNRGSIIDVSPEAAKAGVTRNMTVRQVRQVCPDASFFEYDAAAYLPFSQGIWDICASITPVVETDGPGGAFLDLTGCGESSALAERLIRRIHQPLGFFTNIGIAENRLGAKAASIILSDAGEPRLQLRSQYKTIKSLPFGKWLEIRPEGLADFLAPLPLSYLWCCDLETRMRLVELGIYTIGDLAQVPEPELVRQFGSYGPTLYRLGHGIAPSSVRAEYPPQSLRKSISLEDYEQTEGDYTVVTRRISLAIEEIAQELREKARRCSRLTLWLDFKDPSLAARCSQVAEHVTGTSNLVRVGMRLFGKAMTRVPFLPTSLTFIADGLEPLPVAQTQVFDHLCPSRSGKPDALIADIRKRFGSGSIKKAGELHLSRRERMLSLL